MSSAGKTNVTLARLRDQIENLPIEPTRESILVIANVLVDLLAEVERIDHVASSASNIAGCLANGIKPD